MNYFIDLLVNYWKPIVGLLFLLVAFILALFRKRPLTDILSDIYYLAIKAILLTESDSQSDPNMTSKDKLQTAIFYVSKKLRDKYPTLNLEKYKNLIVEVIESILTTPEKKI